MSDKTDFQRRYIPDRSYQKLHVRQRLCIKYLTRIHGRCVWIYFSSHWAAEMKPDVNTGHCTALFSHSLLFCELFFLLFSSLCCFVWVNISRQQSRGILTKIGRKKNLQPFQVSYQMTFGDIWPNKCGLYTWGEWKRKHKTGLKHNCFQTNIFKVSLKWMHGDNNTI